MKKSVYLLATIVACSSLLTACSGEKTQQVSELKVTKSTKSIKSNSEDNSSKDDSNVNQESTTESSSTDNKDDVSTSVTEVTGTIDDRIDQIEKLISSLHKFKQPTHETYNEIVNKLSDQHINVDESVKGPYGLYDDSSGQNPSVVMSGLMNGSTVTRNDNGYLIEVKSRVGVSAFTDSISKTSTAILNEIKKSDYSQSEKVVVYQLIVSDDRQTATLSRVSDQWW